ncbi:MAG: TatD family hydrolase [bacterium]|nr:TatD family hydrolase [bacterium]
MIDSHCHLADKQFSKDLDAVIERAGEAGVAKMVCIADSLPEAKDCLQIAEKYEHIFCTVGVHPHHASAWGSGSRESGVGSRDMMLKLVSSSPKVVAIGEIGLDYHYDNSPRDVQRSVFEEQLKIAKELNIPAVIHCRESMVDVREIIERIDPPMFVIHCCTEKWEDVSWVVDRGCLLSFTGIATYPKSEEIRRTIAECPLKQMMIETDAPYLAPIPYRGKRNEPAFVIEVAKCIAEVKGIALEEVAKATTENAEKFYGI